MTELRKFEVVWHGKAVEPLNEIGLYEGFHHDAERIARIIRENGYDCATSQAYQMWSLFSEERDATWLKQDGYSHEAIFGIMRRFMRDWQ